MGYAFNYSGLQVYCDTGDELLEMLTKLKLLRECDLPDPVPPARFDYRGLSYLKASIMWLHECEVGQTPRQIAEALRERGLGNHTTLPEFTKAVYKALKLRGSKYGAVREDSLWKLIGALKP